MSFHDLASEDGLLSACKIIGPLVTWSEERRTWVAKLADTLRRVRAADESERATLDFQRWLWEDNGVAAIGQGAIPVDAALRSESFRRSLAAVSMAPLPAAFEDRERLLLKLYEDIKGNLEPFLDGKAPHLKIFRVLAALYPEAMTTMASTWRLQKLTRAMDGPRGGRLHVARHVWVRARLDGLLGDPGNDAQALAERMSLPWILYADFVWEPDEPQGPGEDPVAAPPPLVPLPAARRRRGLTPIRGLFPGVLSTLDFAREGVTRDELLDFLGAASPDAKANSLNTSINVLRSELGVIRPDGNRYVLTERGENVLESQDAGDLADWLLTRVLGVDTALVELRDRGPRPAAGLTETIRAVNPTWSTNFVPQAIVSWLRSMGVIQPDAQGLLALTDAGRAWATRITWTPESLQPDLPPPLPGLGEDGEAPAPALRLPPLRDIIAAVQHAGHFPPDLVARLHASLWSHKRRHFAILTGLSGSGKTLLARAYAQALTTGGSPSQLFTLPVQPGWYDPGALLGYTNPLRGDSYVRTAFVEFLIAASGDPGRPYVVVLDEMNLSHPEQYMAPLLSAMETGAAIHLHTETEFFDGVPRAIPYPSNLVLIGTVNMDETTHGLSDKVLDRAFVLEFWQVDLDAYPRWGTRAFAPEQERRARDLLAALMSALAPARLHFGWRVVDDVLDFLEQAAGTDDVLPFETALDQVIYGKVLPKLRGEDAPRLRTALAACEKALAQFDLSESRKKLAELQRDLETTGSARFWR